MARDGEGKAKQAQAGDAPALPAPPAAPAAPAAAAVPMDPVVRDILEEALSEFANYGFEGTRIESITARTATSKRMIYYHFGSKEKLYEAVLDYAYGIVRSGAQPTGDLEAMTPLQALEVVAGAAFDSFSAHPDFIRLSLQENLRGVPVVGQSESIRRTNLANLAVVERQLRRGQADGSIRKELQPLDVYITFVGLCNYHVAARPAYKALFGTDFFDPQVSAARRAAICDALIRYVRA